MPLVGNVEPWCCAGRCERGWWGMDADGLLTYPSAPPLNPDVLWMVA